MNDFNDNFYHNHCYYVQNQTTLSPALSEKTDRDERTEADTAESVIRVNNILRDRSISLR